MTKHGRIQTMDKNKAYDISKYNFQEGENIFVDANIWLYLFPAPVNPNNKKLKIYSKEFARMQGKNVNLFTDVLILSEYLNRYSRIEYEANYKTNYPRYKDWRISQDFVNVGSIAANFTKQILKLSNLHDISSSAFNMQEIINNFSVAKTDFNDAIFIEICSKKSMKILTDDGDFKYGGIEIITANPSLLKDCK